MSKAIGIVCELRTALDHKAGGEVAVNLNRLYEYSLELISQANLTRTPEPIETTLRVLRTLKEGWDGIIAN